MKGRIENDQTKVKYGTVENGTKEMAAQKIPSITLGLEVEKGQSRG